MPAAPAKPTINATAIDHVQLCYPPGSLDAARDFYLNTLGGREVPMPPSFAGRVLGFWCMLGNVQLHLGQDTETARTKGHPALVIGDVAGTRHYLESLGLRTSDEPDIAGRVRFSFWDPFQNRIEFLQFV